MLLFTRAVSGIHTIFFAFVLLIAVTSMPMSSVAQTAESSGDCSPSLANSNGNVINLNCPSKLQSKLDKLREQALYDQQIQEYMDAHEGCQPGTHRVRQYVTSQPDGKILNVMDLGCQSY